MVEFPTNMVSVTASIQKTVGITVVEYTTSISVQTHRVEEIQLTLATAWAATQAQARDATPTV